MDQGLVFLKSLQEIFLPLPLVNCVVLAFYCESGMLFLDDRLRVLWEAHLLLLGAWEAELMSFIGTVVWDAM